MQRSFGDCAARMRGYGSQYIGLDQSAAGSTSACRQEASDSVDQDRRLHGVDEVLVGAGGKPLAAVVGILVDRGLLDDRDRPRGDVVLEPAADFEAVDVRQRDVEHDEIRRGPGEPESVTTGGSL